MLNRLNQLEIWYRLFATNLVDLNSMTKGFDTRPHFVPGEAGDIFVFEIVPDCEIAGTVLIVPPFAEEMNRSRRMLSLQARQLARLGYRVITPDLYGTGDSAADFGDARWNIWRDDLACVIAASDIDRDCPTWILAVRLGALLALDALSRNTITADKLVLWSPCVSGKQFMTRFLRMRIMASMISKGPSEETIASLRELVTQGAELEVAGYTLAPQLVADIDALDLADLAEKRSGPIDWFEVASADNRPFPMQSERIANKLISNGCQVVKRVVFGPQFWATPEIATATELLTATTSLFPESDH